MKENDMTKNNNYEREPLIGLIAEAEAAGSTIHYQMKNILLIEHELRKAWAAVQNAKRIDMDSIRAEIADLPPIGDPKTQAALAEFLEDPDVIDALDM